MKRRYVLVNPLWKMLAGLIDLGYFFHQPPQSFLELKLPENKLEFKRIALLILDHLGDVVFTTPAVSNLRKAYPQAEITAFVGPWAQGVYSDNPKIDHLEVFEAAWFARSGKGKGVKDLAFQLKKGQFDLAIDFRGDFRHLLAMKLAKVPFRLGYGITGGGFLLSVMPDYPFEKHAVEKHLLLVEALGVKVSQKSLEVYVSPEAKEKVDKILEEEGIKGEFAIIHPGAGSQAKKWFWENFARVGRKLRDEGLAVVVTGVEEERQEAENIARFIGKQAFSLAGKLNLRELIALIEKASLFLGGDTGPLHLASALGKPFVAVYSGTNRPEIWGPWQGQYFLLQEKVDCAPCGKKFCANKKCLASISPAEVSEKALILLGKR